MSSDSAAATLELRSAGLVERYRQRLALMDSPLVADQALRDLSLAEAGEVISDCARCLRTGRVSCAADAGPAADRGERLASHGLHPIEAVRAATALFDVVLDGLAAAVGRQPDSGRLLHLGCRALNAAIGHRLEAASTTYDAFVFRKVKEIRAEQLEQLARDVHDRVGNTISLAARNLELYQAYLARGLPERAEERLGAAVELLGEGMRRTRTLISEMKVQRRSAVSIAGALETYLSAVDARGTRVQVVLTGNEGWLPARYRDELLLMLREALRNAFTHARSQRVHVFIDVGPHEVRSVIEDDGIGFDVAAMNGVDAQHGLSSMRERAALLDGRLTIFSRPASGTRVELAIPLPKRACGDD